MNTTNNKITIKQFIFLLILDVLSTTFIFLPKYMYEYVTADSWIFVILSASIVYLCSSVYIKLFNKSEATNFSDLSNMTFGFLSPFVRYFFVIKNIIFSSFLLILFTMLVNSVLLPDTPPLFVGLFFLVATYFFTIKGVEIRGRIAELIIWIIILFFAISFIIASMEVDFTNALPVLVRQDNASNRLIAVFVGLFGFSGMEYLFLLANKISNKNSLQMANIVSILFLTFILSFTSLLTVCLYLDSIYNEPFPVLMLLSSVNVPLAFIERQDSLVFSIWIICSFFTISAGIFYSNLLITETKPSKKSRLVYLHIIVFILAYIMYKYLDYRIIGETMLTINAIFFITIPFIMSILYAIRRKK